jgi:hypothetical protein
MTNTTLLQSKIKDSGFKDLFLAKACGITERTFYNKKRGKTSFVQEEILCLKKILNLSDEDIALIFFAEEGDESSTEGGSYA